MRHGKKFNHLGRKKAHRKAMLSNMANSLIEHKRITTTVAKAKALGETAFEQAVGKVALAEAEASAGMASALTSAVPPP